jgi:hypothetical protein
MGVTWTSYGDVRCSGLPGCRLRYGIRRTLDGRVELRGKKGDWYNVRLDMEVPGRLQSAAPVQDAPWVVVRFYGNCLGGARFGGALWRPIRKVMLSGLHASMASLLLGCSMAPGSSRLPWPIPARPRCHPAAP